MPPSAFVLAIDSVGQSCRNSDLKRREKRAWGPCCLRCLPRPGRVPNEGSCATGPMFRKRFVGAGSSESGWPAERVVRMSQTLLLILKCVVRLAVSGPWAAGATGSP
jgi:hypothetical protein